MNDKKDLLSIDSEKVKKAADEGKKLLREFRAFISRGNVVDMAVGVVVGTSFTAIINSLVNNVFMPFMGLLIGGINFDELKLTIPLADREEPVVIAYGAFLQAVVTFLLISLVVFLVVKVMGKLKLKKAEEEKKAEAKPTAEEKLLSEILEQLKAMNGKKGEEAEQPAGAPGGEQSGS